MAEIKPIKIQHNIVEHFDPNNNSLGFLNELESLELTCQIAENAAEGYYMIWEGQKITIDTNGNLSTFPRGMWDKQLQLFSRKFLNRKSKHG